MIAETQEKSVKTLREVIIDIIAKRTGGSCFDEILTVMRNYWVREDGKEITNSCVSNHLLRMTANKVLTYEERPSTRPGGSIRYYHLNNLPTDVDTSKLKLITAEQGASNKSRLPTLSWTPPRQHIPRRPNPLHHPYYLPWYKEDGE